MLHICIIYTLSIYCMYHPAEVPHFKLGGEGGRDPMPKLFPHIKALCPLKTTMEGCRLPKPKGVMTACGQLLYKFTLHLLRSTRLYYYFTRPQTYC